MGGTKLAAALVSPEGALFSRRSVPTTGDVWMALADLVRSVAADTPGRIAGVGVGSAGPLDPGSGTVSPVNIPSWRGFPLLDRLSSLVPSVPVLLAGDGACAAAGEHWRGAGRGIDDLLVLVISTGVGGGIIQNGRLVVGQTGNAGHIGHAVVDLDGDPCPCGGRGCVEALASGPSMVDWARRNGWRASGAAGGAGPGGAGSGAAVTAVGAVAAAGAAAGVAGGVAAGVMGGAVAGAAPRSAAALVAAGAVELAAVARGGDPVALAAFARAGRALAAGIVSTAAICDLSRVVIGGGVGEAADLLLPPLRAAIAVHARLGFLRDLTVEPAQLGPEAGLVGAGALVFHPDVYPAPTLRCVQPIAGAGLA